ncbi:alpha-1,2-mannosyltransferase [Allocatelliglobosispora scoriae]|uniref:Alpha-1,2-mannosyltransferase n=1 Tax=Allocatelliglobosispora scoriae TaxID=643052 RepID=A0A841BM53_9ACTN|nr:alpha-1,2-mannosyltransferase [Allocatelliglobosispora scoriae]
MTGRTGSPSTAVRAVRLAALATVIGVVLAVIPGHRGWFDVGVYHGAVTWWVHGGDLYEYLRPGTEYGFTYPPFAALCLSPLALLRWHPAVVASIIANAVAGALLVRWLFVPVLRRAGRPAWEAFGLGACLLAVFEPARDTVSFGQVNLVLLALVCADLRLLTSRYARYAGICIGLAAAIKLTPALFIVYLLVARQRRAGLVAAAVSLAATGLAALVAPAATHTFFTEALWQTSRVGNLAYVSNQSLQGVVARLHLPGHDRLVWLAAVLAVLVVWAARVRRAAAIGDQRAGFALTGLAACLISPITWVHHLVWCLPALMLFVERTRTPWTRRSAAAVVGYALMCSSVVWLFANNYAGFIGFVGSNTYVWVGLALLLVLPVHGAGDDAALHRAEVQRLAGQGGRAEHELLENGEEPVGGGLPAELLRPAAGGGSPVPLRPGQQLTESRREVVTHGAEPRRPEHSR